MPFARRPHLWSALAPLVLLAAAAIAAQQTPGETKGDAPEGARKRDWEEIVGPKQGKLPSPRPVVAWETDFAAAKAQAAKEGRPLFVVLRCQPSKQFEDFDREVQFPGPELDPLLRQFVTVRLTTIQDIDLRQFPVQGFQDLDLAWWGWFLSPAGQVYGVFGGRDEQSDKSRISSSALAKTLQRVLTHHYDPRRASWNVDGQPARTDGKPTTAFDLAGWPSWSRRFVEIGNVSCLHCHQVAEILRQPPIDQGTFDKKKDLEVWPYPENVGIVIDRDSGLGVREVKPDSPAAKAGLQKGDILGAAGSRRLFSQTDFRGVLHRGPRGDGTIELYWRRGESVMKGVLALKAGWRTTDLEWRESVANGNIGANPGMAGANVITDKERERYGIRKNTMALQPWFNRDRTYLAQRSGVAGADVIVAVNGESPNLGGRSFLVWFRQKFDPGDKVTLKLKDSKGRERDVTYEVRATGR